MGSYDEFNYYINHTHKLPCSPNNCLSEKTNNNNSKFKLQVRQGRKRHNMSKIFLSNCKILQSLIRKLQAIIRKRRQNKMEDFFPGLIIEKRLGEIKRRKLQEEGRKNYRSWARIKKRYKRLMKKHKKSKLVLWFRPGRTNLKSKRTKIHKFQSLMWLK